MDSKKFVEYSLIESISSVEDFLKITFNCSSNKLKKYFDKSFLNRSFKAHTTLNLPLNFVNDGEINPDYEGPPVSFIYEDEVFLVMNKPANIFVHPLVYDEKNNCLSYLRAHRPALLKVNSSQYDRGLMYRLDFETSGVLIYLKNESAYRYFRDNFKTAARKKIYLCRVEGECSLGGSYVHYFSSKEVRGRRVVVSDNSSMGDSGELSLEALEYDKITDTTLMKVELKTGLRHQIRAQLAFLGFPLRGDVFYGGRSAKRLYLHAYEYQLRYQDRDYLFTAEPNEFNGI